MLKSNRGPEPGFEPGTEDPQSHMLPGYTIRAILTTWVFFLFSFSPKTWNLYITLSENE
jgi:hypothetical protein